MILFLNAYGKQDDTVAAMEENKDKKKKDIVMQYPLSSTAREFKREEQLLRSAKRRYKDLRNIVDNNVKLLEKAERKRDKLKKKLDDKSSQGYYSRRLKQLEDSRDACIKDEKDPKKLSKCKSDFTKQQRSLARQHNILPDQNRFNAADKVFEKLKRQQVSLSREFRQLGEEIEKRAKRSGDLFEKTPQMPLSRQDIQECVERALE